MKECPVCRRCFPDHFNNCPSDGDSLMHSIAGEPVLDGRYQLEARLGQGGMGVVYRARHIFLKTAHAIKVILPDLVGNDPMLVTRFRQEAMAAAAIRHQNIIAVTDFGVARGTMPFLVMEYVQGKSLHDILEEQGRLRPAEALDIMSGVAAGVGAAHRHGIVHRDLKPLNIMLLGDTPPPVGIKVLDFGLAKIKSGELLGSFVAAQTTGLMGSPFYMAPEQWSEEEPDVRADVYSLGVILFQMLAGDVPFKAPSIPAIMKKHLMAEPPAFSTLNANVPGEIEKVALHALEKNPDKRPQTVEDFIGELRDAVARTSGPSFERTQMIDSFSETIAGGGMTQDSLGEMTSDRLAGTISSSALNQSAQADQAAVMERERQAQEEKARQAREREEAQRRQQRQQQEAQAAAARQAEEERRRREAEEQQRQVEQRAREERERQERERQERERRAQEADLAATRYDAPPDAGQVTGQGQNVSTAQNIGANTAGNIPPGNVSGANQNVNWQQQQYQNQQSLPPPAAPQFQQHQFQTAAPAVVAPKKSRLPLIAGIAAVLTVLMLAGLAGVYFAFLRDDGEVVNNNNAPIVNNNGARPSPSPTAGGSGGTATARAEMVSITGGTYQMGRNGGSAQETPVRAVTVGNFAMDKTEVTNAEYAEFVGAKNHPAPTGWTAGKPPVGQEQWPVQFVAYDDALAFARWRSERDGVTYRLPTEEEWEYAARGGSAANLYPWGNSWSEDVANLGTGGGATVDFPKPVGSYPKGATPTGLQDMIGNVWEWTSSKASFYPGSSQSLPAQNRDQLVVRGGAHQSMYPSSVEGRGGRPFPTTYRIWVPKTTKANIVGFRLVRAGS
ncbi:MAG: bifunctional serine/threonine-protein kinase/formylglycine-generating enzyme family protein [Pyrinomonadaceae bacterium]